VEFEGEKKSSGSIKQDHVAASDPPSNLAIPIWQMLDRSELAVSTSKATNGSTAVMPELRDRCWQPTLSAEQIGQNSIVMTRYLVV
jgi:hypothetical protein